MRRILAEIREYRGPSLVVDPQAEVEALNAEAAEAGQAGAQGFAVDPRIRRLVEERLLQSPRNNIPLPVITSE